MIIPVNITGQNQKEVKWPKPCCDRILVINSRQKFSVFMRNGTMVNGHTLYLGIKPKSAEKYAIWYDGDDENPDWLLGNGNKCQRLIRNLEFYAFDFYP